MVGGCGKNLHNARPYSWGACKTGEERRFEIKGYTPDFEPSRSRYGAGLAVCGATDYRWIKIPYTLLCSECAKLNGFIW